MLLRELTESQVNFYNKNSLRQYIIDAIMDYLDEQDDINELARILKLTVGKSVDIEGRHYTVEAADIEEALTEWKASRKLCTSGKPNSALGASALASCKAQGYRSREGGKSHKLGTKRVRVQGKKIKGKKYGGELPDWGTR